MNGRLRKKFCIGASCLALLLVAATLCLAQATPPPTTRYLVLITQVKPEMLNEWLDAQRNEVNPALKKAGISSRIVQQTVFGNSYEYASIIPLESYSVFDQPSLFNRVLGPEAGERLSAKLRKCVTGGRSYIITRNNELSLVPDPKAPPPVSVTIRRRIAPGKAQEYQNFIRTELLPVYKKAKADGKIAGYVVSSRGLGAVLGDVATTTYYDKFADLDAGGNVLAQVLGQEEAQKILAKATGLSTIVETYARRRVADLSF